MTYRVGIDIGGTFTDFALLKGREVILHKNLSTPEDRSAGVMEGLGKLAAIEGLGDPPYDHEGAVRVHREWADRLSDGAGDSRTPCPHSRRSVRGHR